MILFLVLAIGFGAGVLVTLGLLRQRQDPTSDSANQQPEETATHDAGESEPAPGKIETLGAKLYRLSVPLEIFGDSTAHPGQLADKSEFQEASDLLRSGDVPLDTVTQYALGANWTLACAALDALLHRPDREDASLAVMNQMGRLRPWSLHYALEYLLSLDTRLPSGAAVAGADSWWTDNPVIPSLFRSYFMKLQALGDAPSFGTWLSMSTSSDPQQIEQFLKSVSHPYADALIAELKVQQSARVDRTYLETVGRFWAPGLDGDPVIEPEEWKDLLDSAERAIRHSPPRSLIIRGDEKTGKTSFLKLLAHRLFMKHWSVFEAGGPELQAGQAYIGQLEERVKRLSQEAVAAKRIIWYVPDILQLAIGGTHQSQPASILDQLYGALSTGRIIIVSEATPAQITQLLQLKPHLKNFFEAVPLNALSEERTLELVQAYVVEMEARTSTRFDPGAATLALQLARQYLDASQLPGSVFDLVKLAYHHCRSMGTKVVTPGEIMASLSQVTGLPRAMLNAEEKVELAQVRKFFDARVMGQPEAVQRIVDRIAMLKAGLTDPTKPIGVFLFAGPTGTGKTELAKTLAQFLFSSADRMIRLDMSEYKSHDSLSKIIGEAGQSAPRSDFLINQVRKQPFSVVLLDEFEKAHPNIWDLFLQVFDDGRLTDANGNAADFRHCIIILTSNLGATTHENSGLGFGDRSDVFSPEQVERAIAQAFRPEFVNRLDKVIIFQPLSRALMRQILQKELRNVLERRGLRNREWAVEWEDSAIEFLLDKGFSAQLGARPLKRAVDEYLLAPLAATIVEHRVPEGDQFLFVRSDGRGIQVEFVDPDADRGGQTATARQDAVELATIVLHAHGTDAERGALSQEQRLIDIQLGSEEWQSLLAGFSAEMGKDDFWKQPQRFETLSRLALMDRIKAAAKTADALRERLDKSRARDGSYSQELMSRLARQILALKAGVLDVLTTAPIEAVIRIEPALDTSSDATGAPAWCDQLLGMYRNWASKRGMQASELRFEGATYLLVSGFGAYRVMTQECGLHVLETGDEDTATSRMVARVRVAPSPPGDLKAPSSGRLLKQAIDGGAVPSQVLRRYRGGDAALVRDARLGWRSGKFDQILNGDFDLIGATATRV